jgi:hypothetical protein
VHVVQFLPAFHFAVNVERVESALPETMMRLIMDRWRQPQASEHLPAPGMLLVFLKRFDDLGGRLFFQPLQDQGGGFDGLRLEKQMEVIGHQHPTDEQEFHLLSQLLERLDKKTAKMLGEEKGRPPIGAGGDKLQLSQAVSALVERHGAGEYTPENALPEESPFVAAK